MNNTLIRILDFLMALFGLLATFPILLIVTLIGYFDTGSPIFIQQRVGKNKRPFNLIKFRTMSLDTKSVASHLANTASITKFGSFLRKTKIDEREQRGVYKVLPGITGLAQVNRIDMSTPRLLVKTDRY